MDSAQKKSFKHTLNLPETNFPIRAAAAIDDPALVQRWVENGVHEQTLLLHAGATVAEVQDGPPYANGHIHMGHALNKILKDIVAKTRRMEGLQSPFRPGWDCHGLPIELKVTTELGMEKDSSKIDAVTLKKACRDYANHWISVQREEFMRLGVLGDWKHPYATMDYSYEANILRALATFVREGFIERRDKTMLWCFHCQTVLATAEIEYKDRKDPSIHVMFPLSQRLTKDLAPLLKLPATIERVGMVVWTTTPWTLPLNRAVQLHPDAAYVVIAGRDAGEALIVAQERADAIAALLGIQKQIFGTCHGNTFAGQKVGHPFLDDLQVPIILNSDVSLSDGTAIVHTAPGCGPEDYLLGIKHGLEIFSPLSPDGRYTAGVVPESLEGMSIIDAQGWVIKELANRNRLIHKGSVTHAYPHCWRCHQGLMFRATEQWFCDLAHNNLIEQTIKAVDTTTFIPARGKNRFIAGLETRAEWCLSRQRRWGVPIPALLCTKTGRAYINADMIDKIATGVEQEGIAYWDRITIDDMVAQGILDRVVYNQHREAQGNSTLVKEDDILDVWFEAGVSHSAAHNRHGKQVELYLEGSDQHRAYFQSSVLTSMVMHGHPPMRSILTHGFLLDEKGHKMSKSLGNVIDPQEVMNKYGTDVLRLWVANADFERDVVISTRVLENIAESYRKIRNTARFLLSNLYDFDMQCDAVPVESLWAIDRYALMRLAEVSATMRTAYRHYQFTNASLALNTYCTNDLSALYLDVVKDRLYTERANGHPRRSAQTAMWYILDTLTKLMAPILSFTAELIADQYQKDMPSIHLQRFAEPIAITTHEIEQESKDAISFFTTHHDVDAEMRPTVQRGIWLQFEQLRAAVLKAIEPLREQGVIKHPLEGAAQLFIDAQHPEGRGVLDFLDQLAPAEHKDRFLKDWLILSQVTLASSFSGLIATDIPWLAVAIAHAPGVKCPRCWQWDEQVDADDLCRRCQQVLAL